MKIFKGWPRSHRGSGSSPKMTVGDALNQVLMREVEAGGTGACGDLGSQSAEEVGHSKWV